MQTVSKSDYWPFIKRKKDALRTSFESWHANHPSRLQKITLTGSASLTIDERIRYPAPLDGQMAEFTSFSVSVPAEMELIRLWDKEPIVLDRLSPETHEFYLHHKVREPWRFYADFPPPGNSAIAGSATRILYTWNSTTNSWNASSRPSQDVIVYFSFMVEGGGGGALSGYDPANADARAYVTLGVGLWVLQSVARIRRYPWLDAWDSDSSFNELFYGYIDNLNIEAGSSIASGSSNVMVNFVF